MNTTLFVRLVAVASAMGFSTPVGFCSVADWLGLKETAAAAGREAGEKAAQALIEASRNMGYSVNQLASLLKDFHTGNAKQKEDATRIIKGIFPGIAIGEGADPSFEVAVDFDFGSDGNDHGPLTAAIWFVRVGTEDAFAPIVKSGIRYSPTPIVPAATARPADIDAVRARIAELMEVYAEPKKSPDWKGLHDVYLKKLPKLRVNNGGNHVVLVVDERGATENANTDVQKTTLGAAIMTLAEHKVSIPSSATLRELCEGGEYAVVLIPKKELDAYPDLNLSLRCYSRDKKTNAVTPMKAFSHPRAISMPLMRKGVLPSNDPRYPQFNYVIVDLMLNSVLANPAAVVAAN